MRRIVEGLFTLSGAVTTVAILLIVVFLFREGFGLFGEPAVERGWVVCVDGSNESHDVTAGDVAAMFDYKLTDWSEVGGPDLEVDPFRMEYEMSREELAAMLSGRPGVVALVPEGYVPDGMRTLDLGKVGAGEFFGGAEWMPTATPVAGFGTLPLLMGTLWVALAAIAIALPLGLGVAIYLSELASEGMRRVMKPTIELLAGIPSVVYGFFGLVVVVPLVQRAFGLDVGETGFTGAVILAVMALPTIITVAEDAMRSTPASMREASLALGATRWQTIRHVVIPYARSGISAAAVLGIGRAVGETMAVLMVTGNAAVMPKSLFAPLRTIPATIAAELGEAPAGGAHYRALFMLGCILFVITMAVSVTAEIISHRHGQKE